MSLKPDFIIAGFPKCGTTSLYHYLNQHPQICMSSFKEPHYYSDMPAEYKGFWDNNYCLGRGSVYSQDRYERLYSHCPTTSLIGEASTNTLYLNSQIPRNTKLIVCLRDPIQRAYSHYCQMRAMRRESLSFLRALRKEEERISKGLSPAWHYTQMGMYQKHLFKYDQNNSIGLYFLEDFVNDPQSSLDRITDFLNIDRFSFDTTKKYSQRHKEPFNIPLSRFLPARIYTKFMVEHPKMTSEEFNYLQRVFKVPNMKLQSYLNSPLPNSWTT